MHTTHQALQNRIKAKLSKAFEDGVIELPELVLLLRLLSMPQDEIGLRFFISAHAPKFSILRELEGELRNEALSTAQNPEKHNF